MAKERDEGQRLIRLGVATFLVTCLALVVGGTWLGSSTGEPGYAVSDEATEEEGVYTITLDTSNNVVWLPFSLDLGRSVPPGPAVDLRLRRQLIQAPYGALELGGVPLETATLPSDPEWEADIDIDGVDQHPALSSWYSYSYFSHLLSPKDTVYAVRRANGRAALLQVVSYYCDNESSGCMTLRYRLVD